MSQSCRQLRSMPSPYSTATRIHGLSRSGTYGSVSMRIGHVGSTSLLPQRSFSSSLRSASQNRDATSDDRQVNTSDSDGHTGAERQADQKKTAEATDSTETSKGKTATKEKARALFGKSKEFFKKYGPMGFIIYFGIYLVTLFSIFLLLHTGVVDASDAVVWVKKIGLDKWVEIDLEDNRTKMAANFAVAWVRDADGGREREREGGGVEI